MRWAHRLAGVETAVLALVGAAHRTPGHVELPAHPRQRCPGVEPALAPPACRPRVRRATDAGASHGRREQLGSPERQREAGAAAVTAEDLVALEPDVVEAQPRRQAPPQPRLGLGRGRRTPDAGALQRHDRHHVAEAPVGVGAGDRGIVGERRARDRTAGRAAQAPAVSVTAQRRRPVGGGDDAPAPVRTLAGDARCQRRGRQHGGEPGVGGRERLEHRILGRPIQGGAPAAGRVGERHVPLPGGERQELRERRGHAARRRGPSPVQDEPERAHDLRGELGRTRHPRHRLASERDRVRRHGAGGVRDDRHLKLPGRYPRPGGERWPRRGRVGSPTACRRP
jgi:hypothetical protein